MSAENGRISKIEELIIKHDERMVAIQRNQETLSQTVETLSHAVGTLSHALDNTEKLLVMEGDRIDRLDRIEARQNELFGEISEQLRNFHK
jgi:hypothetical protein